MCCSDVLMVNIKAKCIVVVMCVCLFVFLLVVFFFSFFCLFFCNEIEQLLFVCNDF